MNTTRGGWAEQSSRAERLFEMLLRKYAGSLVNRFADRHRQAGIHPIGAAGVLAGHHNDFDATQIPQLAKKV